MNENDVKLALALLEQACPNRPLPDYDPVAPATPCDLCNGTGKVPLLDPALVRTMCPWANAHDEHDQGKRYSADDRYWCTQGKHRPCPGWSVSDNEMDWVRALNKAGWRVTFETGGRVWVDESPGAEYGTGETLFEAMAKALGVADKEP